MKKSLLFNVGVLSIASAYSITPEFHLQVGDLLFQDLNCGEFCNGIDSVTYGYGNTYVSHVAVVTNASESNSQVIEAVSKGVSVTPLNVFLGRSLDESGNPRVMVGRVAQPYQQLIPTMIAYSQIQLGKPYNASFIAADGKAYYCSELVADAFAAANHGQMIFHYNQMDFTNGESKQILPIWQQYYRNLKLAVPQGELGTNPGMMSRESFVSIIHYYGKLRIHS